MKQQRSIEDMLSRHPEGLTAFQLSVLTRKSETTIYSSLRKMRREGNIRTDQAWDLPRTPTVYMLKKK